MQVEVKHGLPGSAPVIEYCPVTIGELAVASDFCSDELQLAEHRGVFRARFGQRHKMFARDDENMAGRLWRDILESEDVVVFVNDFRGNLLFSNFAKQAVVHEVPQLRVYSWQLRVKSSPALPPLPPLLYLLNFLYFPSLAVGSSRTTNVCANPSLARN